MECSICCGNYGNIDREHSPYRGLGLEAGDTEPVLAEAVFVDSEMGTTNHWTVHSRGY